MRISDWSSDVCSSDLTFWNWLAPVTKKRTPGTTKGGQAFVTTMEDGTPVFANVELAGRKLIVEVNSAARAEQAIAQMSEWLGDCVSTPMTEIRTLAQFKIGRASCRERVCQYV